MRATGLAPTVTSTALSRCTNSCWKKKKYIKITETRHPFPNRPSGYSRDWSRPHAAEKSALPRAHSCLKMREEGVINRVRSKEL